MMCDRIPNVLKAMKAAGISQLLVSDAVVLRYLTGLNINPGERLMALVLRTDGQSFLMLNTLFGAHHADDLPTVYYSDTDDGICLLNDRLLPGETLAVDKNWPARFLLHLQELDARRCVNSSFIIDNVRIIKDADEQEKMIRSSELNDQVMAKLIEQVGNGYDETELTALVYRLYTEVGCDGVSFTPITSFAGNTTDPHHESDHTHGHRGDCLVLDIGGMKDGYASDMTRTVFLGEVSSRQREIYETVLEANLRGIAAARPGNRMCDVDLAARQYIESKGFGRYFTHRTGHSIGMEDHEWGDVSSINTDIIRPGQCFSVEPGIYIPEEGIGVRIEDLVLITEDGCRVLNSYPKELTVIPFEEK